MTIDNMTPDVYYGQAGQQALYDRALERGQQEDEYLPGGYARVGCVA